MQFCYNCFEKANTDSVICPLCGYDSTSQELDKEDGKILLISKYALDCQQYNTSWSNMTWETCTLRSWLKNTFYVEAFSDEEQKKIADTRASADKNPQYNTSPGNSTTDRIYLLSIDEVNRYFRSDDSRKCAATEYAKANGAYANDKYKVDGKSTCCWWLRSPGSISNNAAYVSGVGAVCFSGYAVNNPYGCARPALWINSES